MAAKEEMYELMHVFNSIDKDGNGRLNKEELFACYKEVHGEEMANAEIQELLQQADTNKDGIIDYEEWVNGTYNHYYLLSNKRLAEVFSLVDKDGSKTISLEEVKAIFQGAPHVKAEEVEKLFRETAGGSSEIDAEGFKQLLMTLIK